MSITFHTSFSKICTFRCVEDSDIFVLACSFDVLPMLWTRDKTHPNLQSLVTSSRNLAKFASLVEMVCFVSVYLSNQIIYALCLNNGFGEFCRSPEKSKRPTKTGARSTPGRAPAKKTIASQKKPSAKRKISESCRLVVLNSIINVVSRHSPYNMITLGNCGQLDLDNKTSLKSKCRQLTNVC